MTANQPRKRPYTHVTRSRFLNIEDALEIGKIRLFAGQYRQNGGATSTAYHFLDLDDARVLLADLSWGKKVTFTDYKGTNGNAPQSRVLKIKTNGDQVWLEIQNGPGETIGQGAVKPKGKPTAAVSIPLTVWEARKLAHAVLAYIRAWETRHLLDTTPTSPSADPAPQAQPAAPALSKAEGTPSPPVVTETGHQACPEQGRRVAAPVTTPPEVFENPRAAVAWAFKTGAFKAELHAHNAYQKLKTENSPKTAREMAALWVADVQKRLAVPAGGVS